MRRRAVTVLVDVRRGHLRARELGNDLRHVALAAGRLPRTADRVNADRRQYVPKERPRRPWRRRKIIEGIWRLAPPRHDGGKSFRGEGHLLTVLRWDDGDEALTAVMPLHGKSFAP